MSSVVVECDCGTRLKIDYDGDAVVTLRCPQRECKTRHVVTGKVINLWLEGPDGAWSPVCPFDLE